MRGGLLFFVFLIIWIQVAQAQSIIIVDVKENGDALWTMEKRLPLINESDIQDWEEFINLESSGNEKDIEDFSKRMDWFLLSAQKFSNRPMKAEKFNISYNIAKTPSGSFGIIQYRFEWKNFSHGEVSKISIGDAFSEGMVLSQDNVLIIEIPEGYDVESVSPKFDKRDENRLIWDGTLYRNFNKGEPAMVLTHPVIGAWYLIIVLIIILSVIASGAYVMVNKKRNKTDSTSNVIPPGDLIAEDLKYEEMIERFLKNSNGQAPQSDIINEIGLSKSRVSTILSKMKERGQIIKIKNGNGNLIRLVNNK